MITSHHTVLYALKTHVNMLMKGTRNTFFSYTVNFITDIEINWHIGDICSLSDPQVSILHWYHIFQINGTTELWQKQIVLRKCFSTFLSHGTLFTFQNFSTLCIRASLTEVHEPITGGLWRISESQNYRSFQARKQVENHAIEPPKFPKTFWKRQ